MPVIDDFEDGDLSEYPSSSSFSVDQSIVHDGSYALSVSSAGNLSSTSGLANYPSQGDTFTFWYYPEGQFSDFGFVFAAQSEVGDADGSENIPGYYAFFSLYNGNIQIDEVGTDFAVLTLASGSASLSSNNWYKGEVHWATNGEITFTVYDSSGNQLQSITATSDTYSSGGVGYYSWAAALTVDTVAISGGGSAPTAPSGLNATLQ